MAFLIGVVPLLAGFFCLGASDPNPSVTVPLCRKRAAFGTACGMAGIALVARLGG